MSTDPRSTALSILDRLAPQGVTPETIGPEHIPEIYAALPERMTRIDPAKSRQLLPRGGEDGARAPTDELVGVIVESRVHPNLEPAVREVCARGIDVQVYHCPGNRAHAETALADLVSEGRVHLTELAHDGLSRNHYNALCLDPEFWRRMIGRGKILVFQCDAALCAPSPFPLSAFSHLDYVGSDWERERPEGVRVDGGNGGLSLRDWSRSVECLERFPPELWRGGEDTYFAFFVQLIGGKVADRETAARFSSQYWFRHRSFGAHQIDSMHWMNRVLLTAWSPSAGRVMRAPRAGLLRAAAGLLRAFGLQGVLARALGSGGRGAAEPPGYEGRHAA